MELGCSCETDIEFDWAPVYKFLNSAKIYMISYSSNLEDSFSFFQTLLVQIISGWCKLIQVVSD
jgi:hypothetical protein